MSFYSLYSRIYHCIVLYTHFGVRAPTPRPPEIPAGQKEAQTGSKGGPAASLDDFSFPFGSSADPQGTTFGALFGIFLAFLLLFRRFLSRALFGFVFGWFRDLADLENTTKTR